MTFLRRSHDPSRDGFTTPDITRINNPHHRMPCSLNILEILTINPQVTMPIIKYFRAREKLASLLLKTCATYIWLYYVPMVFQVRWQDSKTHLIFGAPDTEVCIFCRDGI